MLVMSEGRAAIFGIITDGSLTLAAQGEMSGRCQDGELRVGSLPVWVVLQLVSQSRSYPRRHDSRSRTTATSPKMADRGKENVTHSSQNCSPNRTSR
jgi:hypothetical protein